LVLLLYFALILYAVLFDFPHIWLMRETDGLIRPTMILHLTSQLLLVAGCLIAIFKLQPRELGLDPGKLPVAIAVTLGAWMACQGLQLACLWFGGSEIAWNPVWTGPGWTWELGRWLTLLLVLAPNEEMIFRGFLVAQLVAQLAARRPAQRPQLQVAIALLASTAVFALSHVPGDWKYGQMWLLPWQFVVGLLFAGVYLRTGNLFLTMGVHTLFNCAVTPSMSLVQVYLPYGDFIILGPLFSLVLSPWNRFFRSGNGADRPNKTLKLTAAAL
jgi:membrane protease YdiL (CAAX protease family)